MRKLLNQQLLKHDAVRQKTDKSAVNDYTVVCFIFIFFFFLIGYSPFGGIPHLFVQTDALHQQFVMGPFPF